MNIYNNMKWIKLTSKTFNEILTAYRSGKGVILAKAHTQFAGAIYFSYHIYRGSPDLINCMIKEDKYFYMILDEPNFK